MKRLILFEIIILFLATTFESDSPPPGWFQQTLPVNDIINDIYFTDSLTGWVVTRGRTNSSDTGYIMKTTDGGNNWVVQVSQILNFNVVQFLDINTGYSGGGDGFPRMLKTTNSGNNWLDVTPSGGIIITDMQFINKDTGWACNDAPILGGLWRTTNGSNTWQQQLSAGFLPQKLFFLNRDTGWVASSDFKLYRTNNSGVNWNLIHTFNNSPILSLYFLNSLIGFVGGAGSGNIKLTTDGGFSWNLTNGEVGGYDIKFVNDSVGYAGGGSEPLRILKTINGGRTWWYQNAQATPDIPVSVLKGDTLLAWAGKQLLIHTTDGGGQLLLGINQISNEIPEAYELYQNYPNPFNPLTNIGFRIKDFKLVTIKIYDVTGKEIAIIVNRELTSGVYEANWNASNYTSGIYFYSLIIEGKVMDTKKMILIK